jgi:iron(III) transport system permease protein
VRVGPRWSFALAALALLVLGVLPLLSVAVRALAPGAPWAETLANPATGRAVLGTLRLATGTTVLAVLLGAPLAWLTARSDLPGRGLWVPLLAVPYVIPPYVAAVAWINLANPHVGFLNALLGPGTLNVYSMTGLTWVMGSSLYPYVFLTVRGALANSDPALEDAARMSGAGTWRVFRDVSLPLVRPAILSSGGLVFVTTASAFGAPALIGGPARQEFLATRAFEVLTGGYAGTAEAAILSVLLLSFAVVPFLVRPARFAVLTGRASRPARLPLGRARRPLGLLVGLLALVAVVLPALAVAVTAFLRVAGDLRPSNFTLENLRTLAEPVTVRALLTSLGLAAAAATVAVLLGGLVAFFEVKTRLPGRRLLAGAAALPLGAPGTVLALGLILAWTSPIRLRDTLWILLVAYVAKHVALAARAVGEGLATVDDALPEAARVSGARGLFLARTVWIPLVFPAVAAGWFLVFAPAFSELTMSVLLVGPGTETVGTRVFELQEYESPTQASVLATLILAFVVGSHVLLGLASRGRSGFRSWAR